MHVGIYGKTKKELELYDFLQKIGIPVFFTTSLQDILEKASHVVVFQESVSLFNEAPVYTREDQNLLVLKEMTVQAKKELLAHFGFFYDVLYFTLWGSAKIYGFIAELQKKTPEITFLLTHGSGIISCQIVSKEKNKIFETVISLQKTFSLSLCAEEANIAFPLQELLIAAKKKIAFAESCTGGHLAEQFTRNPGSSNCFLGSFVTYSMECKENILRIPKAVLSSYPVVSAHIAQEMLLGVFHVCSADFGIAVTGLAGPGGGSLDIPVGRVFIALGEKGKEAETICLHLTGSREEIISEVSFQALGALYQKIRANY